MMLPKQPWADGARISQVVRLAILTILATCAVIALVVAATRVTGASFGEFSRDPAAVLKGHVYIGYLSNLGVLIWAVGASAALVAGVALSRTPAASLLIVGGALTALMVVDDLFLLHEDVYPTLGISQLGVAIGYAVLIAAFAWRYRRQLGSALVLLGASCVFWGLSAVFDAVLETEELQAWEPAFEDGAKFIGIGLWTVLLVRQTIIAIRLPQGSSTITPGRGPAALPVDSRPIDSPQPGRHRHRENERGRLRGWPPRPRSPLSLGSSPQPPG